MDSNTKERFLKLALVVFGVIFLLVYPLSMLWPSGWDRMIVATAA